MAKFWNKEKGVLGIMSAMHEEIHSLIDSMEVASKTEIGGRIYYTGVLFDQSVVCVFSHWGKVASSVTAVELIRHFEVKHIVFTGVAGSIVNEVKIGDLVSGEALIQHDMNASPLYPKYVIPLLNIKAFKTTINDSWNTALKKTTTDIPKEIKKEDLEVFGMNRVNFHSGLILSGDQFISSQKQISTLKKDLPEAVAVEMEGAAVAQVCEEYKIPFNVLRIISDNADNNADVDFPLFASKIAANISLIFFRNLLKD